MAVTKITEHVDEEKASDLLHKFYQTYRTRDYGMFEIIAFIYEQGWNDHIDEVARERANGQETL